MFCFKSGDILGTNPSILNHSHARELQVALAIWIQETGKSWKETLKDLCFAAAFWTLDSKTRIFNSQTRLFLLKELKKKKSNKKWKNLHFIWQILNIEYVFTSQSSFFGYTLQVVSWKSVFMFFSGITHKHISFHFFFFFINISIWVYCSSLFSERQQNHIWLFSC